MKGAKLISKYITKDNIRIRIFFDKKWKFHLFTLNGFMDDSRRARIVKTASDICDRLDAKSTNS